MSFGKNFNIPLWFFFQNFPMNHMRIFSAQFEAGNTLKKPKTWNQFQKITPTAFTLDFQMNRPQSNLCKKKLERRFSRAILKKIFSRGCRPIFWSKNGNWKMEKFLSYRYFHLTLHALCIELSLCDLWLSRYGDFKYFPLKITNQSVEMN